jgi:ubiquinone/menaquinone biosynthesis C-methylase UbiE
MNNFWNERYSQDEFVYGKEPNQFLAGQLQNLPLGKIIFPCDGEGRNSVYAGLQGWETEAFDLSEEGMKKALRLAKLNDVDISYKIADAANIDYPANTFDAAALIYAHFPMKIRSTVHQKIMKWLKPGGLMILEAFNPLQIYNTSGGPKDLNMLYTVEMLQADFKGMHVKLLETKTIILNEGAYHQGLANVIRFVGMTEK